MTEDEDLNLAYRTLSELAADLHAVRNKRVVHQLRERVIDLLQWIEEQD